MDHDHETLKFRGLLCSVCNRQLGWYENNKDKVHEYLNHTPEIKDMKQIELNDVSPNIKIYNCSNCGAIITSNSKFCSNCASVKSRKVNRPNKDELKKLIRTTSFVQIAKQFNVSDKAIAK